MDLILKLIFMLSLLVVTANNINYSCAAKTKPKNLISATCPKTKNPKKCLFFLNSFKSTRRASSLRDLGVGTLGIAVTKANTSVNLINNSLLHIVKNTPVEQKYEGCRDKFKSAIDKLSEAKEMVAAQNFEPAEIIVKEVSEVPSFCQKELGKAAPGVRVANAMSDIFFDIALVVVKELVGGEKLTSAANYMNNN